MSKNNTVKTTGFNLFRRIRLSLPHSDRTGGADFYGRDVVFVFLLVTSCIVASLTLVALFISYTSGNTYVAPRILVAVVAAGYLAATWYVARRTGPWVASVMLVLLYGMLAMGIAWQWGMNLPFGLIAFAIVIVLAGILLRADAALSVAATVIVVLILLQMTINLGIHRPDISWTARSSNYGDVVGYSLLFLILAVTSWLFGREMERSLTRAEEAEAALTEEKRLLESRVEERSAALEAAQFEEMQQLYRFAEVGHLSTAMMHELASYLTALTLDIENLNHQESSTLLLRAQRNMRHLDVLVGRVKERLRGKTIKRSFNVASELRRTVDLLEPKRAQVGVKIKIITGGQRRYIRGDPIRFSQIAAIIITNAIEAYEGSANKLKPITITVSNVDNEIAISVCDFGKGLTPARRRSVFKPFHSTKHEGMGIGLYIAKGMAKTHFNGDIRLGETQNHTEFVIILPHVYI